MNNISKDVIIRSVVTLLAVLNQILVSAGVYPKELDENTIFTIVSSVVTLASVARVWWKNNSITDHAQKADDYLKELKQKQPSENENSN